VGYDLREINIEGKSIKDILAAFDLTISNTYFIRKEKKILSYTRAW
jgi:hypothetical protein